jgi:hypothetical protein
MVERYTSLAGYTRDCEARNSYIHTSQNSKNRFGDRHTTGLNILRHNERPFGCGTSSMGAVLGWLLTSGVLSLSGSFQYVIRLTFEYGLHLPLEESIHGNIKIKVKLS